MSPFFSTGDTLVSFQILGSFSWSVDIWKINWKIGARFLKRVCSTIGFSWSGPGALWGLSLFKKTLNSVGCDLTVSQFSLCTALAMLVDSGIMKILQSLLG